MSTDIISLLKVIFISAVPLIEQRGAIPMGIFVYKLNPILIFMASYIGSLIPAPFILLLFNIIFDWMKKFKFLNKFNDFIDNKVRKGSEKVGKYKKLGLVIFVAIPLPTTGLWTGSAVAAFLGLDFKKSFLFVALGGLISAIIITLICVISPAILGY